MSRVTNLIFTFSPSEYEKEKISLVNSYKYGGIQMDLVSADYNRENKMKWYGGTKYLEAIVYLGAFNHLNINDFVSFIRQIEWKYPEEVQLIVKEQEDERFKLINVFDE